MPVGDSLKREAEAHPMALAIVLIGLDARTSLAGLIRPEIAAHPVDAARKFFFAQLS